MDLTLPSLSATLRTGHGTGYPLPGEYDELLYKPDKLELTNHLKLTGQFNGLMSGNGKSDIFLFLS
jgi:hypothetical protein